MLYFALCVFWFKGDFIQNNMEQQHKVNDSINGVGGGGGSW